MCCVCMCEPCFRIKSFVRHHPYLIFFFFFLLVLMLRSFHQVFAASKQHFDSLVETSDLRRSHFSSVSSTQACIDGSMEMVSFLLDHSANVNQVDSEGWTPLHVAASCGYPDIVE